MTIMMIIIIRKPIYNEKKAKSRKISKLEKPAKSSENLAFERWVENPLFSSLKDDYDDLCNNSANYDDFDDNRINNDNNDDNNHNYESNYDNYDSNYTMILIMTICLIIAIIAIINTILFS